MSTFWTDQLEVFKAAKKKSAVMVSLIELTERVMGRLGNLEKEANETKAKQEAEIALLKKEIKDLRHELDIAWKNQD